MIINLREMRTYLYVFVYSDSIWRRAVGCRPCGQSECCKHKESRPKESRRLCLSRDKLTKIATDLVNVFYLEHGGELKDKAKK